MALVNWRSPSSQSPLALSFFSSAGTVKFFGSMPYFTCVQVTGVDTGAPGRPRGESGGAAVAIRSLRR
jgi:hypothetical protein